MQFMAARSGNTEAERHIDRNFLSNDQMQGLAIETSDGFLLMQAGKR
jgi:hypothetical protein